MTRDPNGFSADVGLEQIGQMGSITPSDRQLKHLIEVAIVEIAALINRN